MAAYAWEAYNHGRKIYCNCPVLSGSGLFDCILNFPHTHLNPEQYYEMDLFNCYLLTDESAIPLDSRNSMSAGRRDVTAFARQAKKRGVSWHYDTIRKEDIDTRVRNNPDFLIYSQRIPPDIKADLIAIKIVVTNRVTGSYTEGYFTEPRRFFPIYNHLTMVRKTVEVAA
ncbi:MAG TPA: hypothetical protein VJ327_01660 [Patescibacteria group bacterium]|nr:hypothetical protein [Patescibacteria group bacterium]